MIKIEQLTEDDLKDCANIVLAIGEIYGDYFGDYYKLNEDGVTKYLHRIYNDDMTESAFTILTLDENNLISYEQFDVDGDYNVLMAGFEDYVVTYYEENVFITDKKTNVTSSILFTKRQDEQDLEGYTGLILYSQYNVTTDERCYMSYQQMYNDFNLIYRENTKDPFIYNFETGVTKGKRIKSKSFVRININGLRNPRLFDFITIKEFGLSEFLSKGSYKLQKEDHMSRYFRNYKTINGFALTGFPFTSAYKKEEFTNYLKDHDFNTEVPDYLVELYNKEHKGMKRYEEIAALMKELCSDFVQEQNMKMVLFREVANEDSDEEN